jgi:dUTP pyrophosphatase
MDEHQSKARNIYGEFQDILSRGFTGAVYLPWFYRSTPPYVFLSAGESRALIRSVELEGGSYRSAPFLGNGYAFRRRSAFRLTYRFEEGRDFFLETRGCEMAKEVAGEQGWLDELALLYRHIGFLRLAPIVGLEEGPADSGGEGGAPVLRIKRMAGDLPLPSYAHPGDAGMDLASAEDLTIAPGGFAMVSAGFAMALPEGYAAFVQPRSGLAAKHGISIVNTPGLIDCHYRGEVRVILINHGREPFRVSRGDRIAQMVIQRVEAPRVAVVEELDDTARGEGGFGSTGR